MRQRRSDRWRHLVIRAVLALQLFPFYMMVQISVKTNLQFIASPWTPPPPAQWQWDNFAYAARLILPYVANSIFVAVIGTLGSLVAALFGAYFFARRRMPLSRFLWGAFLLLLLLPTVVNIVPLFTQLRSLRLLNTLTALIVVGIAGTQAFNIYVLRNFIEDIPKDLFEAAEIDGASHLRQVLHVALPMCLPILGTLAIVTFLGQWNDFLLPLIISRDQDVFTVGVGLVYLEGEYVKEWGRIMAAFMVASMPMAVLFLFTMKWFVRGLASGAIKG
jgi:multiple sugar transport system permease protein